MRGAAWRGLTECPASSDGGQLGRAMGPVSPEDNVVIAGYIHPVLRSLGTAETDLWMLPSPLPTTLQLPFQPPRPPTPSKK
jgi:hypothetical protein